MSARVIVLALAVLAASGLQAGVIFSDNFNGF